MINKLLAKPTISRNIDKITVPDQLQTVRISQCPEMPKKSTDLAVQSLLSIPLNPFTHIELTPPSMEPVVGSGDFPFLRFPPPPMPVVSGDVLISQGFDDDLVHGSPLDDYIDTGFGNDRVYGHEGNDIINTSFDNDMVYGGEGNDTINTGFDNDVAHGDEGDDTINASFGDDEVHGGSGHDTIEGGFGNDIIYGGSGNDTIKGGFGNDQLYGGSGDDVIDTGGGNDIAQGGSGADTIRLGFGGDVVVYRSLGDSTSTSRDVIEGFSQSGGWGRDKIDLQALAKHGIASIDDLNVNIVGMSTIISSASVFDDFEIELSGHYSLSENDFIFGSRPLVMFELDLFGIINIDETGIDATGPMDGSIGPVADGGLEIELSGEMPLDLNDMIWG